MQLNTSLGGAPTHENECLKVQAKRAQSLAKILASWKTCKKWELESSKSKEMMSSYTCPPIDLYIVKLYLIARIIWLFAYFDWSVYIGI